MAGLFACENHQKDPVMPSEIADINDSLRNGNVAQAIRMTDLIKSHALSNRDSMLWSEAMVQQGINAYYQGNPPLVLASSDSAIYWLERQKSSPDIARILAKAYQTHGAYYDQYYFNADSSIFYLRKAVENVELSGLRSDLPQAYGNYANALRMGASLDSAALYYHKAISVADSLQLEPVHYIPLYNGIAAVFTDMHDYDNGAKWWEKSMAILNTMNQFDRFNTLSGYGNHLYYKENYEEAEKIFKRIKEMLDSIPGSEWESMFTNVNLADIYIRLGNPRKAEKMLDEAVRYFSEEQPNPMVISHIHTLKMRAATSLGDFNRGLEMARQYPEADTLRLEQHLARLKAMENLYANIGNHRLAYITRCRHDHLDDSLRSYHLSQQISALNAMYQRDHRILNLEAGNTRQQAHIYKLTTAIAISLAIIVGLILFFVVRRVNVRRREDKMMNKIISLRQENLRNRVTPHFIYNALNHELHNAKKGKPSHLDSLVDLIRKQQIVASEFLIPFSEELKFTDDYIRVISDNGSSTFVYDYSIDPEIDPNFAFPSMTLQILVENAFKHGFTTLDPETERRLKISVIQTDDNSIAVSVFNNCGPSPSGMEKGGTGLRVLLETIRLINEHNRQQTHFKIDTKAEINGIHGCIATITIPNNLKP
ncbi:MAG: tetratricopeptide repeat protein [Muribaculaceae bacterium]|nr:tetratricopeptide repeat protein [Muribaculaceae bacterium]